MGKERNVIFRLSVEHHEQICRMVGTRMMETGKLYTISMWMRNIVEVELERSKRAKQDHE